MGAPAAEAYEAVVAEELVAGMVFCWFAGDVIWGSGIIRNERWADAKRMIGFMATREPVGGGGANARAEAAGFVVVVADETRNYLSRKKGAMLICGSKIRRSEVEMRRGFERKKSKLTGSYSIKKTTRA